MSQAGQMTVDQAFAVALQHHQAGRLPQAEGLYRQILAVMPGHTDAMHLLGVMAIQVNQPQAGVELIEKAIGILEGRPAQVPGSYWSNLGEAWRNTGETEKAMGAFARALAIDPQLADAGVNQVNCLLAMGRAEEALGLVEKHLRTWPNVVALHRLHGDVLIKLRRVEEAIAAYRGAVRLNPGLMEAHFNLGVALTAVGRANEAVPAFQAALRLKPDDLDGWMALGEAYSRIGYSREALAAFGEVLKRDPNHAGAHAGQGMEYRTVDRLDESIAAYGRALAAGAGKVGGEQETTIRVNFALALRDAGDLAASAEMMKAAMEGQPGNAAIHSAYVMTQYLLPWVTEAEIEAELARWDERHGAKLLGAAHERGERRRLDGRRLRVGYVSADFRSHPVGRFMWPVLGHHDRSTVEVFCYSVTGRPDAVTTALRQKAEHWRNAASLVGDELAEQVRRDGIDVLVDLSMHTVDNALLTFARKPAPVQMTYLAYCAGTGLRAIDWRLTDGVIDPERAGDGRAFEKPLRLETYWCYVPHPVAEAMAVGALPAAGRGGQITLGSFNFFSKVNEEMMGVWAELLKEVAGSRLMLHVPAGSVQEKVRRFFGERGVGAERLVLLGRVPEAAYFEWYKEVDIALDTYPFAGGTTTCDALWMGVPVVTRTGDRTTARGGASLLTAVGLGELIARDWEVYRAIAKRLAGDVGWLAELRAGLRERMRRSVLMDAPRFVRRLEEAYRGAWEAWWRGG